MPMTKTRRWMLAAALPPLTLAACTGGPAPPGHGTGPAGRAAGPSPAASGGLTAVRHVWVLELENQGYAYSFGAPSADPYLARTLPRMGALLENYYAIGHSSAANYIAQISGQAPNLASQSDCPVWTPLPGHAVAGPYHQVLGAGCVYPAAVQTLGGQLSATGHSWAAYLPDMGNDPARDHTASTARGPACGHPATRPPGPSTTRSVPSGATTTPPATTVSRASGRSPRTRPSATRTSCPCGHCRATWPAPAPRRRSRGSRRTCATTAMTRRVSPAPRVGWRRPTHSWPAGCRRSWLPRPTGTAASS